MRPRIQHLQRLEGFSHRTLAQSPRLVHSSSRRDVSATPVPSTSPITPSQLLSTPSPTRYDTSRATLSRLPTASVLRTYLITGMSSSPILLSLCLDVLRRMLNSKSYIMSIERNPALQKLLKSTFYAQFCAGENKTEVADKAKIARELLGYDGIMLEFALEVLKGMPPTAAETAKEIAIWRKGMLESIDMAKEGDFVGLKWSGLGRHALQLLQAQKDATPEMWEAITAACDAAAAKGVGILPGAEEEITNIGLEKWNLALQKRYNTLERGRAIVYTTYQCYLKSISSRITEHLEYAQKEGYIAGVKLVRGAYIPYEPRSLIWDTKEDTDACYDACTEAVLKREWNHQITPSNFSIPFPEVDVFLGTHNAASVQKAQKIRAAQLLYSPPEKLPRLAYAQLQGMADEISQALVQDPGMKVDTQAKAIKCMTWGTTTECLNFLLRRANENKEAALRTEDTRRAMGAELWRRIRGMFGLA